MIIQERLENGLIHTYSNSGVYIHGGSPEGDYTEAVDPVERTYVETDIPIETEENDDSYATAGKIMMGVME